MHLLFKIIDSCVLYLEFWEGALLDSDHLEVPCLQVIVLNWTGSSAVSNWREVQLCCVSNWRGVQLAIIFRENQ